MLKMSAAERLGAINTPRAITLCVTTRSIGFGTVHVFQSLFEHSNVPDAGNIYQFYRVSLAAFQAKVIVSSRSVLIIQEEDYVQFRNRHDFIETCKYATFTFPDHITRTINSIGQIRVHNKLYIPKVGKTNRTKQGMFIPQPEQITLHNLRDTVTALNNEDTPVEYRRQFYQNNPLPGATWQGLPDNPLLQNPDEIMPPNYDIQRDLEDDIEAIRAKIQFLKRKEPSYFTKPVNFSEHGNKSILVSNDMNGMRITDRSDNEKLSDYYKKLRVEGNVNGFANLEVLSNREQIDGIVCLLGERPASTDLLYPIYLLRDERACNQLSILTYKRALHLT